ncbi:hypothetical protein ACQKKE_00965 [Desemzia incerta]|uniref:hypothetical protein n=1 Tax=Desemzia incerta TaxID=82801 RepID=UPI003D058CDE
MKIINIDKNGNVIPDLSKVVLPEHVQKKIVGILMKGEIREINEVLEDKAKANVANHDGSQCGAG